ncbi:hypothetical protein C475_05120 [Halosimplex carlsbadense 2-9-1]|uniref:Uncharacterized protein n=1 Tax=Halosimplex carlsbadense 2-9-1 TaxID=797114 RepID=M0D1X8_9EURY|nr:hypothetical protein C475_05120 [Halosimplex carlsbadense 2-9-1]
MYAEPARKTTAPSAVNSKKPNARRPGYSPARLAAVALARRFVEVPMSVSIPPICEAYDSGISSFDGEVFPSLATSVTTGTSTATTGVLLTNPETGPATPTVASSCRSRLSPANAAIRRPRIWTSPVRLIPALKISIASTVIVAGLENPEIPSLGEIPVHGRRTTSVTMIAIAVTSIGSHSVTNSAMAPRTTSPTTTMSTVTPAGADGCRSVTETERLTR